MVHGVSGSYISRPKQTFVARNRAYYTEFDIIAQFSIIGIGMNAVRLERNYAAQFHSTSNCIKFGEGAQSPRNLRAIGRVYCVMQGSAACSFSLSVIIFW